MKPILKWVGGKRLLIPQLKEIMPLTYNRYFEPFIGGGALFFDLQHKNSVISDFNSELINVYRTIAFKLPALIEDLQKHNNTEEYYYQIRALDRDSTRYSLLSDVEKASRFIFLNKTGYSGLYRVNRHGQYNVPYGKYKNPNWQNIELLEECSKILKDTKILEGDFEHIKELIKPNDLVYFDPPYVPLNKNSFTAYTANGFDVEMQNRLKSLCDYIDNIGAYFMLSNSNTEYILELYSEYNIHTIFAKRSINSDPLARGKVKEVVVTNY